MTRVALCLAIVAVGPWTGLQSDAAEMRLIADGRPQATIVCGAGDATAGRRVREVLRTTLGCEFALVTDDEVMEPGNWRLRDPWLRRPLILVGDVHGNRALFALLSRFMAAVGPEYPGVGRYVLRVLFEPWRRDVNVLVAGASDQAGQEAGLKRLTALLAGNRGVFGPLIELGDASGRRAVGSRRASDFTSAAYSFYWGGHAQAGDKAKAHLLGELARRKRGLWGFDKAGHYHWEQHYRLLLPLLATGVLSEAERGRVEARMLDIALGTTDWAGRSAMTGSISAKLSRHPFSGLTGQFLLLEYLHHIGRVPEPLRAKVAKGYKHTVGQIEAIAREGRFRSNLSGAEGMDVLNNMAALYLHLGDGRVVRDGVVRRMADYHVACKDNLGRHIGDDAYITCRPGSHYALTSGGLSLLMAAYLHRDGQYRWFIDHTRQFYSHLGVRQPPEFAKLAAGVPPEAPRRYHGLVVTPTDPWWYEQCRKAERDAVRTPVEAPRSQTFSKAVFRDGFDPQDAFLVLQGVNTGTVNRNDGFQGNSIVRYTELGSLLLFSNSMRHTSWARTLVTSSRGKADPLSMASVLEAQAATPLVSAVRSRQEHTGGMRWTRSIVHRRHAYFVVLDELVAHEPDTYNVTCRWRSFHPGAMTDAHTFDAVDGMRGVRLRIQGATRAAWQVDEQRRDGAARPTLVTQRRRARLERGQGVRFHNLVFASSADAARTFATRPWTDHTVLIKGRTADFAETAVVATDRLTLRSAKTQARVVYASRHGLVACGLRRFARGERLSVTAGGDVNLILTPEGASIENTGQAPVSLRVGADARKLSPGKHPLAIDDAGPLLAGIHDELEAAWRSSRSSPPMRSPELNVANRFAFEPAWRVQAARPERRRHGAVRVWAEPPVEIGSVDTWRNGLLGPPQGLGWHGSERAGWKPGTRGAILMDMGEPVDIEEIRLVRSRRAKTLAGAFTPGEFAFDVVLSNDRFQEDVRRKTVAEAAYEVRFKANHHYTHTMRFPMFTVTVEARARYVKLVPRRVKDVKSPPGKYYGTYQDGEVSFMHIEVRRRQREPRVPARLRVDDFGAKGGPRVLHQSGRRLTLLSTGGKELWRRDLGSSLAADAVVADVDGDGEREILAFTMADRFTVHDHAGRLKHEVDVFKALGGASAPYILTRPACIAAWRPDAQGRLEYAFFPHYIYRRITPAPELAVKLITYSSYRRSAKYAFTVPDVTGDGRRELALVGTYGMGFAVVGSDAPLETGKLDVFVVTGPLTGYSSGNMELTQYYDGAVVRDRAGEWLGVVALNPGGVDFYTAKEFKHAWGRFHHPPTFCHTLTDLDADGRPEVLVGRGDGYVVAYDLREGEVFGKAALDGEVRALASWGEHIVAGTSQGLVLLDRRLRLVGYRAGGIESLAVTPDGRVLAAHSTGEVVGYRLDALGD